MTDRSNINSKYVALSDPRVIFRLTCMSGSKSSASAFLTFACGNFFSIYVNELIYVTFDMFFAFQEIIHKSRF